MRGRRLRVKQEKSALAEALDEVNEGDFAGVARAVEHRFPEERPAEADAIEPANELVGGVVRFDAVGEAKLVQPAIRADELAADPRSV